MKTTSTAATPRIYVGTYAKYNRGSIEGAWLDIDDYSDKEEFLEACAKLHKDEKYPEFMFQDFEGFPRDFYSESSVPDTLFEWANEDEGSRRLWANYIAASGYPAGEGAKHIYSLAAHCFSKRCRRYSCRNSAFP